MEVDHLEQVVRLANALSFTLKTLPNNVDFGNTIFQDTLNSLYLLVDTCNSMQKGKNDKEKGLSANFSNFKIKVEKEETVHTKFENTNTVRKESEIKKENFVEILMMVVLKVKMMLISLVIKLRKISKFMIIQGFVR